MTNPVRTAAGILIVTAVVVFLCVVAGKVTLVIVCAAGLLLVAAFAWAQVEDWRKQRRHPEDALARKARRAA
jgi:UDP-N-acetylmuramyl pentapeptide phosphotransferase/UDP-N-acetylglucosamine-1-phosphate transferase